MKQFDIILITAEPYVDHPFSGSGLIKKVLEDKGFSVGIIDTPDWKNDSEFLKLGKPKLFFGVTSGSIDSMLFNYTPLKKVRSEVGHSNTSYLMPNRAVIYYCNTLKRLFKDTFLVLGGIESSLRRFAHYDYWDNNLRKSIILDTRADILVYGHGEKQIIEIADTLKKNPQQKKIENIKGTCIVSKEIPDDFTILPSYEEVTKNKISFCKMQTLFDVNKNIGQKFDTRYVLQYKQMVYTTSDLDYIYGLNYSRVVPKTYPEFKIIEFSVLTHRGCFGNCNFCSINALHGKTVVSRSKESIIEEIKTLTKRPNFKGTIELSAATANMYGMDCNSSHSCTRNCLNCQNLDITHRKIIDLMREARTIPGVKNVFIKSGVRYDLALNSPEYIKDIVRFHIDETLMIAPEHTDPDVLKLMNKEEYLFEFLRTFDKFRRQHHKNVDLSYYLMVGHPGCTIKNSFDLSDFVLSHKNTNYLQVFTPTPMTVSTCMYYTGMDPKTMKKVYVPYTYNEKKKQKNIAMGIRPDKDSDDDNDNQEFDEEELDENKKSFNNNNNTNNSLKSANHVKDEKYYIKRKNFRTLYDKMS